MSIALLLGLRNPEEVIAETKEVIRAGTPGGGFVISSSNSIHSHVNPDLYLTMLNTIRDFGTYPINLTTTKE
jgi:uroporphyrinogen decarboxylase